jgi:hypothetical protein
LWEAGLPVWLNYVVTVVGLIGVTTLLSWLRTALYMGAGRQWVRLHARKPLTIVLVTSSKETGGIDGVHYVRPSVSLATLLGANEITSLSSRLGYKKALHSRLR